MITINELRRAVHEARMNTMRLTGQSVGMGVVVSFADLMSLKADPAMHWFPRTDGNTDMSIDGQRMITSPDLKEGEIKILADLGAL